MGLLIATAAVGLVGLILIVIMLARHENWLYDLQRDVAGIRADGCQQKEEGRCGICMNWEKCPAYMTGVIYPCPNFEEEKSNGT